MGAIFGQTSSLPLLLSISGNNMDTQSEFFPSIVTLGDILNNNGYTNVFSCGSDATFGGRELFFKTHGNYDVRDIDYRKKNNGLDEDYYVFWGFEDKRLFDYAKDDLLQLAQSNKPFNYTMLTVDTHFEDGYLCDICPNIYDEQYANVMACSSKQVYDFIEWIKQQDFYDNTTIVLIGDHLTMDSDYCDDIANDYQRRSYVSIINGDPIENNSVGYRKYSTQDMFPTTLAALGVKIEDDRLGFGTNLYSGKGTLLEEYGLNKLNNELSKSASFIHKLSNVDINNVDVWNREGINPTCNVELLSFDASTKKATFLISDIFYLRNELDNVLVRTIDEDGQAVENQVTYNGDGTYSAEVDVISETDFILYVGAAGHNDETNEYTQETLFDYVGNINLITNSLNNVLQNINKLDKNRYVSFISLKGQYKNYIDEEIKESLSLLGLSSLLDEETDAAYAIIKDNANIVQTGSGTFAYIRSSGYINDEIKYITSSSKDSSVSSSIILIDNGKSTNYSLNKDGFNIVIFDKESNKVIYKKNFNTSLGEPKAKLNIKKQVFSNTLNINVSDIQGVENIENVFILIYDKNDYSFKEKIYLDKNSNEYNTSFDLENREIDDISISIYAEKLKENVHIGNYN